MFTYIRTNSMAPGKWAQAMTFAHDVARHMNALLGVDVEVSVPIGGDPNQVAWTVRYESLAAMQAASDKLMSDAKYREMMVRAADCFMPAAGRDALWRRV